jgi:hypothetical protein
MGKLLSLVLGVNPLALLSGALAIGWGVSMLIMMGDHAIELRAKVRDATLNTQITERLECRQRLASTIEIIEGKTSARVAAGEDAARLAPILKDRAEMLARCKVSKFCRIKPGDADLSVAPAEGMTQ